MPGASVTLGVKFDNVFGPRWARCKPSALGNYLNSFKSCPLRRLYQLFQNFVARKSLSVNVRFFYVLQTHFLLFSGRRVDSLIKHRLQFFLKSRIELPRVGLRGGANLGRQQSQNQAVLVGGPHFPVPPQETRTRALFTSETTGAVEKARREPLETYRHFLQF